MPANQVSPSLPQHNNFGSLMSLAFPEFATSDTPSPFPKKILNQELAASELLYRWRLRQPLPFNQPGRYSGSRGRGGVKFKMKVLSSPPWVHAAGTCITQTSPITPGTRIWGCQAGAEAAWWRLSQLGVLRPRPRRRVSSTWPRPHFLPWAFTQ